MNPKTAPLPALRDHLQAGILVLDGGTGTQLYEAGIPFTACFEAVNVEKPELVESIHRAFLEAGADAIATNTFGANRYRLAKHGMAERVVELADAGGRAARKAAGARLAAPADAAAQRTTREPRPRRPRRALPRPPLRELRWRG